MYLVCFVIVLRVVFEDLGLFRVVPSGNDLVKIFFLPPRLAVLKHLESQVDIELASSEKPELFSPKSHSVSHISLRSVAKNV